MAAYVDAVVVDCVDHDDGPGLRTHITTNALELQVCLQELRILMYSWVSVKTTVVRVTSTISAQALVERRRSIMRSHLL